MYNSVNFRHPHEFAADNFLFTENVVFSKDKYRDNLIKLISFDFSTAFDKPLFRQTITRFEDLTQGSVLTGKVQNCVSFGVFVDIGVGESGLIHRSCVNPLLLKGGQELGVGDMVEVKVLKVEAREGCKKRIGLTLLKVL